MADLFYTLDQLTDIFWEHTTVLLGFDPENPEHADKVRKSWPINGAPAWKKEDNITFLSVVETDDPINRQIDTIYTPVDTENLTETTGQTRVISVTWICYGPLSYTNAFTIKRKLYNPRLRAFLKQYKIYLVPEASKPNRVPELFAGQWWERCDFKAQFNVLTKFEETIKYIQSAEVQIIENRGELRNVGIKPEISI
jgi:hypothetical protein